MPAQRRPIVHTEMNARKRESPRNSLQVVEVGKGKAVIE